MKIFAVAVLFISTISATNSLAVATAESSCATTKAGGSGVHVPIGKDGEGEYTASTKGCFDVINAATPLVLNEIEKQPAVKLLRSFLHAYKGAHGVLSG